MTKLCVVEDDPIMAESLMQRFTLENFDVTCLHTCADARRWLSNNSCDVVLCDIRLPDGDSLALLTDIKRFRGKLPVWIFITGYGAIDTAVSALKLGARDFITKPFDLDQLIEKIEAYMSISAIDSSPAGVLLGVSNEMRQLEERIRRIANQAEAVLIEGESGVGKEVVARSIHDLDPRMKGKPFVAINCAAIAESIAEAEFFGYERGAFTGASKTKRGYFEQANGGTLFLDEIGDLALTLQAKLLRVLQDKMVVRLGAEQHIRCSFKLICATNRSLKKLVSSGLFRDDLYYRVAVFSITVPPLRGRPDDIFWLADQFLHEGANVGSGIKLSPAARAALIAHEWPGNVRELKNVLARARVMSEDGLVLPQHLELDVAEDGPVADRPLSEYLASCEKQYIGSALQQNSGHLGQTAISLGISRKTLWEKLRRKTLPESN